MIKLVWTKGLQFTAEDEHGHRILVDTDKQYGGFDQGIRPLEFLLVGLAGCMGMDIVSILQKKGGKITNFEIIAEGQRISDHPKKYEKIVVELKCDGDYKREDLLRSFELSRDKYCGAYATLQSTPEIDFVIHGNNGDGA